MEQTCPIGRAMELLGERWTLRILRESFQGVCRFTELQRSLGIARNILSARLQGLVAAGILERSLYHEEPDRYEYRLTDKGRDLYPTLVAITQWGDRHLAVEPRPAALEPTCSHCGEPIDAHDLAPEPAHRASV